MAKLAFYSHDLQGVLDKEEVYNQLAYVVEKHFGIRQYLIFEVDSGLDQITTCIDRVPELSLCKRETALHADACRARRVADEVVSFYNPRLCPHFNCDHTRQVRCCLPVVMGGRVGAVFSFLGARGAWDSVIRKQVPVIRKYLAESAPVLSSLRLLRMTREQALRDPLTHCQNRRFLDEFIAKSEPLSEREQSCAGFLMVDVDYFKQVNDQYGHEAGDAILKQLAGILRECVRRSDLVIRYGGEEFLILLQEIEAGAPDSVAEKIRLRIEQNKFRLPSGGNLQKTISIGVSEYPQDADTMYKAIKFADVALYSAKGAGRNRVIHFDPEMWADEDY